MTRFFSQVVKKRTVFSGHVLFVSSDKVVDD